MSRREVLTSITNTPGVRPSPSSMSTKFVSPSPNRNNNIPSPNPMLTHERDDTAERKERRRSRVLDLQRRNLASPSSPDRRRSTPLSGLTSNQLADHYASCIKLSTENKINAKNAFSLQLIDYMSELLKKEKMENFQIASSTLDASAKIYAGRVDCIHAEAYKVLSGLGRGSKSKSEEGDDVEDGEPGEDNPTGTEGADQQKKKRKVRKSRTVETNLNNITVNKFDLEFEVDPMFQVMSAAFDEGGSSGLILNNLRCYHDCQKLELDSSTLVSLVDSQPLDTEINRKPLDVTDPIAFLEKIDFESKQMCSAYADFQFSNWDGSDMSSMLGKGPSEHVFDMDAEREPILHDDDDDDHHSLPPDMGEFADMGDGDEDVGGGADDSMHSEKSHVVGDSRAAQLVQSAFEDLTHGSVGTLMQILASEPSDYSYFNKALMQTWAGPSHWRRGRMSKDPKFKTMDKSQKSKTKKPLFRINYHEEINTEVSFKTSKATTLTKTTLSRYSKDQTTLPEDLHYDADKLFRLFLKPKVMIKRQQGSAVGVDDEITNYDYNNENDRENFCADLGGDDDDDNGGGFDFNLTAGDYSHVSSQDNMSQPSLPYNESLNATSLCGDKLLSQPYKVAKIDINYARTAKKLDVRKLKGAMWNLLTTPKESTEKHPIDAEQSVTEQSSLSLSNMSDTWTFQTLLDKLPEKVSSNTAKNLSVPIAFVCLLHLANEKTLKILDSDMQDLQISQGL